MRPSNSSEAEAVNYDAEASLSAVHKMKNKENMASNGPRKI